MIIIILGTYGFVEEVHGDATDKVEDGDVNGFAWPTHGEQVSLRPEIVCLNFACEGNNKQIFTKLRYFEEKHLCNVH